MRTQVKHAHAGALRSLQRRFAERLQIQACYWRQIKGRPRQPKGRRPPVALTLARLEFRAWASAPEAHTFRTPAGGGTRVMGLAAGTVLPAAAAQVHRRRVRYAERDLRPPMNAIAEPSPSDRIPRDAAGWVALWRHAEIPVLEETAQQIEGLRAREDEVDARMLAAVISTDPLMCLKLLAHVSTHRTSNRLTDTETATAALVMLGIGPFFRQFGPQPSVQERMGAQPQALDGLMRVLARARRAACFALGFAVHRMDHDAEVIHQAALLHDFAEMLLWCHAPALALQMAERQAADATLRSATVQRDVLNAELADVQQGLMRAWRLPELLVRISGDQHVHSAQVRNVLLAIRLARHTQDGWDNAAVPDDVSDIAALLNLRPEPALKLLHELDT